MIYEYAPHFAKKKEKMLTYGCMGLGLLLFAVSWIEGVPYPASFQLLGMGALTAMILLFSLCIAKHYVYGIEEKEGSVPDFVITEYYGRRVSVVCRVSVTSVQSALPWNEETRQRFAELKRGTQVFQYSGVLFDERQYCLRIEEAGSSFWVRICADDELIRCLTVHETQETAINV